MYVLDQPVDQIRVWIQNAALSAKAKAFLEEVIAFKNEQSKLQREHNAMQAEHNQLAGDENRYRENIRVLGQSPKERELRERYLEKLAQIDDRMGQLRASMQATDQKRREVEAAMAKRVLEFKE